jgi:hypothetical protein
VTLLLDDFFTDQAHDDVAFGLFGSFQCRQLLDGQVLADEATACPSLIGTPPASRVIVVQWPSLDKAQAWANSPDTQALFNEAKKYATLRRLSG